MATFAPTDEQAHVVDQFSTGDTLAVNAYAGTGKTSTLMLVAEAAGRRPGQYVAFNKAIVTEAGRKFPKTVACNTAHSLAFRAVGRSMAHRLNARRMKGVEIARVLGVQPFTCSPEAGVTKTLSAGYLAGVVMRTVSRFCQSAETEPLPRHVPYQDGIDRPAAGRRTWDNNMLMREHIMGWVRAAWRDLMEPEGLLPYKHEHYLKAWQLGDPFIPADYIMFDEAQDANPVMLAIVANQEHAQRVYVGDAYQQIYTFTGAVNALQSLGDEVRTASLTQSFRFGPAIAELANVALTDLEAPAPLLGFDQVASTVGYCESPDAILTRTNARAMTELFAAIRAGRRPHLVGGGKEVAGFARAANDLMAEGRTSYPDLACFESWGEVQEYVEQDPQGSELALMVKLVDEFGTSTILEALDRMPSEASSGLVISTAHKAKGREWHRVQLGNDFPDPVRDARAAGSLNDPDASNEELRLLYVAVTRGQHQVDATAVPYFDPEGDDPAPLLPAVTA